MQYILTEDEMQAHRQELLEAKTARTKIFNDLCQMVADHMSITKWPGSKEDPKPWGCIKSKDYEWYCDDCPVVKYCGMNKHFSK